MSTVRVATLTAVTIGLASSLSAAAELQDAWRASGLAAPESVVNDAASNTLYVSNMNGGDFVAKDGKFEVFLQDPALEGPNGLIVDVDQGKLIVAAIGDLSNGFDKRQPSNVKIVDLATEEISDFGSPEPIGGLDGLEPAGDGAYLVTDFFAGKVLKVMPDGKVETLKQVTTSGSADLEYVPSKNLVVVPLMNDGEVAAFKIGD